MLHSGPHFMDYASNPGAVFLKIDLYYNKPYCITTDSLTYSMLHTFKSQTYKAFIFYLRFIKSCPS